MPLRFVRPGRAVLAALLLLLASPAPPASADSPEEGLAQARPFFLFTATHNWRGTDIYRSDGTADGTTLLFNAARAHDGPGVTASMAVLGQRVLAVIETSADFSPTRPGLYRIGRTGAPKRILDPVLRRASQIAPLQTIGRRLFLGIRTDRDFALYETNGTPGGTQRRAALRGGIPVGAAVLGDRLLLLNNEGIGDRRGTHGRMLAFDPEAGTLEPLFDFPSDGGWNYGTPYTPATAAEPLLRLGRQGGRLVFWRQTPRFGIEPWVSDGTQAGTRQLADVNRGPDNGSYEQWNFRPLGERALFLGLSRDHGGELWATDGTPEGTLLLRDIHRGPQSSEVRLDQMTVLRGKAYFAASSGPRTRGLWVTDGTPAGTRQIPLRHKGEQVQLLAGGPRSIAAVDGLLYFEGTKVSPGCPSGTSRECRYDVALYSYDPVHDRLRLRAQTTEFACAFANAYVAATYAGGSYRSLAAVGKSLFFAASGQRKVEPTPRCGSVPFNEEPWLYAKRSASEIAQVNPGRAGSQPEFIGWSGCKGRC